LAGHPGYTTVTNFSSIDPLDGQSVPDSHAGKRRRSLVVINNSTGLF
jgi:hypothetical protein